MSAAPRALPPGVARALGEAADAVRARAGLVAPPALGLVLGSGLGPVADALDDARRVPYAELPHVPSPSVAGHAGELVVGVLEGVPVVALRGRVHLYEGHPAERVVFPARLLAALGAPVVVLTNAAGGIAPHLGPGSLLAIADHLNLTGHDPLRGDGRAEAAGHPPHFLDLTDAYDPALRRLAQEVAAGHGEELTEGVYAGLAGPSYETPAEVRMLRALGADAVGMSTVLETIALRHQGVRVLALSSITNAAAGRPGAVLDHTDVQRRAQENATRLAAIVRGVARRLGPAA